MNVEEQDWQPPSVLRGARLGRTALLVGAALSVTAHALLPAGVFVMSLFVGDPHSASANKQAEEQEQEPLEIIETRFVKLGRDLKKYQLPNKVVPAATVAAAVPDAVPTPNRKRAKRPDKEVDATIQKDADDVIAKLGNRIDDLAKEAHWDQDGNPDGIEGGEASADEGDIYAGKLYRFFRRGWQPPSLITDLELKKLRCKVLVTIGGDARLTNHRISSPSGNSDFDESVRIRLRQVGSSKLPDPPESYIDRPIQLVFSGAHVRR